MAAPAIEMPELAGERTPRLVELAQPTRRDRFAAATQFGGITPERLAAILRNVELGYLQEWFDLCDWMIDTDAHLASVRETRLQRAAGVDLELVAGTSPDPVAQSYAEPAADLVRANWEVLPNRTRVLRNICDAVFTGLSVGEMMFDRVEALPGWRVSEVRWRAGRRFRFGDKWEVRLYDGGEHGPTGEALDPQKFIVHLPQLRSTNPAHNGVLRQCAWTWLFKQWIRKFAVNAAEAWGHPLPIGKVVQNATAEVRTTLRKALQNLSAGQAGIIEEGTEIQLLEAVLGDGKAYMPLIEAFNAEESKAVLGSVDNVEHTGTGTYASSQSQADVTIDPRTQADVEDLCETLDRYFVRAVIGFNLHLFGGRWPALPCFRPREAAGAPAQLQPHHLDGRVKVRQNEVRASLNLPALTPEEGGDDFIAAAAPAPPAFSQELGGGEPAAAPFPPTSPGSSRPRLPTSPTTTRSTTPAAAASTSRSAGPASSPRARRFPL